MQFDRWVVSTCPSDLDGTNIEGALVLPVPDPGLLQPQEEGGESMPDGSVHAASRAPRALADGVARLAHKPVLTADNGASLKAARLRCGSRRSIPLCSIAVSRCLDSQIWRCPSELVRAPPTTTTAVSLHQLDQTISTGHRCPRGLVKCASNPLAVARRRTSSLPQPVRATRATWSPHARARIDGASSSQESPGRPMSSTALCGRSSLARCMGSAAS